MSTKKSFSFISHEATVLASGNTFPMWSDSSTAWLRKRLHKRELTRVDKFLALNIVTLTFGDLGLEICDRIGAIRLDLNGW